MEDSVKPDKNIRFSSVPTPMLMSFSMYSISVGGCMNSEATDNNSVVICLRLRNVTDIGFNKYVDLYLMTCET